MRSRKAPGSSSSILPKPATSIRRDSASWFREQSGELRLAGLNADLQTLFELTKLDTLFAITRTAEEALAAF